MILMLSKRWRKGVVWTCWTIIIIIVIVIIIITTIIIIVLLIIVIIISEMVERGGDTSLDLLDGDCVLRPQVFQYPRNI